MEVLTNDNVVIKCVRYDDEVEQIVNYIKEKMIAVDEYLQLVSNKMCTVHLIDSKAKLDILYSELIFDEHDRKIGKEVPSGLTSFCFNDNFFILKYDAYKNVFKHDKTTFEEYEAEVLAGIIPILQRWRFGKLSNSKVIDQGLAAFLSGQDTNVRMLMDSYHDLIKSDNTKAYGDFFKYIDSTYSKEQIFKLLSGDIEADRIQKIYVDYKRQFLASRGK